VAAITFPLTNPDAPGGPYRPDILDQPGDMATVAEQVIAASANGSSPLHGVVDPTEVALAGQSDGGDTALALAYNTCCRVIPVAATVILSGAELHSYGGFPGTFFPSGTTLAPLLAFQGTDDPVFNPPAYTNQYFAAAPQPKYLVCLNGADHLEAYTTTDTYEAIVAQASVDFLDAYLWHQPGALAAMTAVTNSSVADLASSCPLT
jgi:predicted dienelactone hydrolase